LGFYNPLLQEYSSTSTLRLLLRASNEVERARAEHRAPRPFFLIFDEMNLARVEHYFSDFLSAMESGEPMPLLDEDQVAEDGAVPKEIALPPNLFVVGTVNVDETTYMFSPKVLDRAFVLEFNDVALGALDGDGHLDGAVPTPLALSEMSEGFKLYGKLAADEWASFCKLDEGRSRHVLEQLHGVLEQENRHFGYRVAREIARFVSLAAEQTGGSRDAVAAALDVAVLAKVLPKLHGTQAELERLLEALFAVAVGKDFDAARSLDAWVIKQGRIEGTPAPQLPRTATKLLRMRRRLRAQGFVSFIE
jgi:5-methylcytosine-specific restriction endonuclease McrBC GTP-binding regulatory subunit McrB